MNAFDMLKKINTILSGDNPEPSAEVALMVQVKTEDGAVLEVEKLEAGYPVFVITEDEKTALPQGEYVLEDKTKVVVDEMGMIASVGAAEEVAEEEEVEMTDTPEAPKEIPQAEAKKVVESTIKESHFSAEEAETLKVMMSKFNDLEKEVEALKETNVELTKEKEALKVELESQEAESTKHSPEATNKTELKIHISPNRRATITDKAMAYIANNN